MNYYFFRVIFIISIVWILLFHMNSLSYSQDQKLNRIDIEKLFTPSGFMGDGEYGRKYINFLGADKTTFHSPPSSIKITYTFGPTRWGGIYWQNKPDNWGDKPGNNYSGKGFSKITFWARGEEGDEVVEFKAGGIDNQNKKYRDSFEETIGRIPLSREWKLYQIDLSNADLGSVIGGFCWVASTEYNSNNTIIFYLDDIFLE